MQKEKRYAIMKLCYKLKWKEGKTKMKKTIVLSIIFMLILGITGITLAAEGDLTATLEATANKQTVLPGEEVVITLTLKDIQNIVGAGITNITTKIDYDTNIFEVITQENISSSLLAIYNDNENTQELTIATTTGITQDTDVAKITFKVKENVLSTNTTIAFTTSTVNESNGTAVSVADATVALKIGVEEIPGATLSSIAITKQPTKVAYKTGEKFDTAGMEVTATYSDGKTKVVSDYTYTPMGELKETDQKITITYKEGTITKTAEQKITVNETGTLPDTGIGSYTIAIIAILALTVISFIKVRKYNNI